MSSHRSHVVKGLVTQQSTCGKHSYASEDAALHAIAQENRGRKKRGLQARSLRPYRCSCGRWHVTRRDAAAYWTRRRSA